MRRSKADWRKLIEAQQHSGLSAAQFCRDHLIDPKYFSTRKRELGGSKSEFVQVSPPLESKSSLGGVKLRVVEFEVPSDALLDSLSLLLGRRDR